MTGSCVEYDQHRGADDDRLWREREGVYEMINIEEQVITASNR
jgi:hypothetical protein